MTSIKFILTCEGTSDSHLVEHIKKLLILRGANEAVGEHADLTLLKTPPGNSVREKLAAIEKYYPNSDVIFVHRDSDNAGIEVREKEILDHSKECRIPTIPLIPVKVLETWLLSDSAKIEEITGSTPQDLPKLAQLESCSTTKDILKSHSHLLARRRQNKNKVFYQVRAQLCDQLSPDGPVSKLSSHQAFVSHIDRLIDQRKNQLPASGLVERVK